MQSPRYPSLYQIKTRVWLTALSRTPGRPATLDDIPDAELDRLAEMGSDWVWFLSVWQTGSEGPKISRSNAEWRKELDETLPGLREDDIPRSGFAITGYIVHRELGGDAALPPLNKAIKCDVLIVGGGFSGMSAAAEFLGKGLKVVLAPPGHRIEGTTPRTPAWFLDLPAPYETC
jgi:hypothetical protein